MRIDRIKLITEMARADMKVGELAEKAGVSTITVTSLRSGKGCKDETAQKIADALGLPVEKLV